MKKPKGNPLCRCGSQGGIWHSLSKVSLCLLSLQAQPTICLLIIFFHLYTNCLPPLRSPKPLPSSPSFYELKYYAGENFSHFSKLFSPGSLLCIRVKKNFCFWFSPLNLSQISLTLKTSQQNPEGERTPTKKRLNEGHTNAFYLFAVSSVSLNYLN